MVADKEIDQRIFVKGFPRETTENELKTFFETYGTVKHVNIVKDHKSGLAKYGFVTFESKDVQETLCQEKSIKFHDKTLCIWKAFRRQGPPEKNGDGAAHGFRRYFPSRQSSLDYSSSTAPMAYYVWPFYNQNPVYVPAVQASTVAQISSPSYQTSYIPSNPQVFTTLMPGSPSTSTFVQSLNSAEQFLLPMPRTNYVEGYTDYQTIPSIITLPMTHGNDWPSTESGMSIFAKEVRFVYLLLFFNTNFSVAKLVRFAAPF
jgi:hypothetical protein